MDPQVTRYVHLMDGGIADNLALRSVLNALITLDTSSYDFRHLALNTRRILVISVDGQAAADPTLSQKRVRERPWADLLRGLRNADRCL